MKKVLIIIGLILMSFLMYLAFWFHSATDTKNVNLSGYIFDKETKKPIQNAEIKIINYRYENDNGISNYDEYLGEDKYELKSDNNGFYEVTLNKSAFIVVEIDKVGYKSKIESDYSSKYVSFKTSLEKTNY